MAKVRIKQTIIDRGWNKLVKEIRRADNSFTKIGLQSGSRKKGKAGGDLVNIAAFNEFGTSRIPARPFIRTTFDQNFKKLKRIVDAEYLSITLGKSTVKRSLGLIGEWMTARTKEMITKIKQPPNAPSTVRRKGSSNPLIDTGQMRASVTHVEEIIG